MESTSLFLIGQNKENYLIKPHYYSDDSIQLVDEVSENVLNVYFDEEYSVFRVKGSDKIELIDNFGNKVKDEENLPIMVEKPITNSKLIYVLFQARQEYLNKEEDDFEEDYEDNFEDDFEEDPEDLFD